jgi:ABC-type Fe3+/spermidine/putrescine transport system ATPase subunit
VIEVQGVSKRYGRIAAVDGLSFTVRPGQVTGFLGPNGAGKSTTLRMMLGLDRPDSGRVLIDGRPYRQFARPLTSARCWRARPRTAGVARTTTCSGSRRATGSRRRA